ncbi:MAG: TlpA disulfide reductase family protein [Bacteroidota bacterium]
MKWTKSKLINGAVLVFLMLYLFTPVGFYIKVQINSLLSFSPSALVSEEQERLTDYQWPLKKQKGGGFNLEENRGKVVLLNFWATWCAPCVAEMPSFQKLYDRYSKKVEFVFLASDTEQKVGAFLHKKNYTFPVYFAQAKAPDQLSHKSIPTTYIIDRKGNIVLKEVGTANWNSDMVSNLLDELLKEQYP